MVQTTKPKAKKPSRTARLAKIRARADEIGRAIRIKKSRIAAGGGGAFTTVPIKRGECVGFYLGAAGKRSENRDYIVEGDGGPSRDAYDAAGRLVVDGRKVNCHGWTADDWTKLKREATVTWAGVESSWTRFPRKTKQTRPRPPAHVPELGHVLHDASRRGTRRLADVLLLYSRVREKPYCWGAVEPPVFGSEPGAHFFSGREIENQGPGQVRKGHGAVF